VQRCKKSLPSGKTVHSARCCALASHVRNSTERLTSGYGQAIGASSLRTLMAVCACRKHELRSMPNERNHIPQMSSVMMYAREDACQCEETGRGDKFRTRWIEDAVIITPDMWIAGRTLAMWCKSSTRNKGRRLPEHTRMTRRSAPNARKSSRYVGTPLRFHVLQPFV
jgi:hypothetical protein